MPSRFPSLSLSLMWMSIYLAKHSRPSETSRFPFSLSLLKSTYMVKCSLYLMPNRSPFNLWWQGYAYMPTSSPPVLHRFPCLSVFDDRYLLTWTLSGLLVTSRLTFLSLSMSQISNYLAKLFGCSAPSKLPLLTYQFLLGTWHKKDFPFISDSEVRNMLIWRCCFGAHLWADFLSMAVLCFYMETSSNNHISLFWRQSSAYSFYALGSS